MVGLVDGLARSIWSTLGAVIVVAVTGVLIGCAFDLSVAGSIGLYFVVWWTVLFMILPVRIRSQAEIGAVADGTDPGAPAAPALRERAIWTSAVSTAFFALMTAFFPLAGL